MSITGNPAEPPVSTLLCHSTDIAEGTAKGFEFRSDKSLFNIFVLRWQGKCHAFINQCPHAGMPLDTLPHRFFTKDGTRLICSAHGATFDPASGDCLEGPCKGKRLFAFPVHESDGAIRTGVSP